MLDDSYKLNKKEKTNWYRVFHPSKYLLETELEYLKIQLAQTQKRLDDANSWIRDSKVRNIPPPQQSSAPLDKQKTMTKWAQYKEKYQEDLDGLLSVIEPETNSDTSVLRSNIMAHFAKDGTPFTNRPQALQHDRKTASVKVAVKMPKVSGPMDENSDMDMDKEQDQPKDIMQDQHAMELVDELKQMGYSAEDVEQAFNSDESEDSDKSVNSTGFGSDVQLPHMKG